MRSVNGRLLPRDLRQHRGLQLSGEERIVIALIDKRRHRVRRLAGCIRAQLSRARHVDSSAPR